MLHRDISIRLKRSSGVEKALSIKPGSRVENRDSFELGYKSWPIVETAERDIGGSSVVFALPELDPLSGTVWFSWHEEWSPDGPRFLDLYTASLTFFWGRTGRKKGQVLRAEWDHKDSGLAAQPHWHVDAAFLLELREMLPPPSIPIEFQEEGTGDAPIEEIPSSLPANTELREIDLSGLHLGMGGWENAAETPDWWQRRASTGVALAIWAERTLSYARDQFRRLQSPDASAISI